MAKSLVVKVTHGLEDPERAHIGCNVATVAMASGIDVHLVLAIEGVNAARLDMSDSLPLAAAPPIFAQQSGLNAGAVGTVCAAWSLWGWLGGEDVRPRTGMAGAAWLVGLATAGGATAIVY